MDWRLTHESVIVDFLRFLNQKTNSYILKGGTALAQCYGLDRFSEDIDLDGKTDNIQELVSIFCTNHNYTFRVAKDTDTVKRCMINYGDISHPLKVEVSLRDGIDGNYSETVINGINVYSIDSIFKMKCSAYVNRDRIRDLYDLGFVFDKFGGDLSENTLKTLDIALEKKGIEQFDYLVQNDVDEIVDLDLAETRFLNMYEIRQPVIKQNLDSSLKSNNSIESKIQAARETAASKQDNTTRDLPRTQDSR
jgi:hypothetical protein